MASKKRAVLNPELLAARAAKRALAAAQSVAKGADRSRRIAKKAKKKATVARKQPGKSKALAKRKPLSKPAANSNIMPIAEIAAQSAFARKGTASAAAFRPWYWRY